MDFYTSFAAARGRVLARGYKDGRRYQDEIDYSPLTFSPSEDGEWTSLISAKSLAPMEHSSIDDAKDFVKSYEGVDNFEIHGDISWEYQWACREFLEDVEYDRSLIRVGSVDVEVESENGFPDVETAENKVLCLTLSWWKHRRVAIGLHPADAPKGAEFILARDEADLLEKFLCLWEELDLDVLSGWNIDVFDVPYLVHRIKNVLGSKATGRLSPWGMLRKRTAKIFNREHTTYKIVGREILDLLELYKKYSYSEKDSYKLDSIAHAELGERKLDYSEYSSLHLLYLHDWQKYVDYNVQDDVLVERIADKTGFIDLAMAIAYDARVGFGDVFSQVRCWDCILHHALWKDKIAVPPKTRTSKNASYAGAYVKAPQIGLHRWIASFDLASMYPHLMMQHNISPETIGRRFHKDVTVDSLLAGKDPDVSPGYCVAANGWEFRRQDEVHGILPKMMEIKFKNRGVYKKKMLDSESAAEAATSEEEKRRHRDDATRYKNMQLAMKVQLNSAYGALGNEWSRYYDVRLAEAITLSGQLAIRWIENKINEHLRKSIGEDIDYVLASDTDSVYLNLDPLVRKIGPSDPLEFLVRASEKNLVPKMEELYRELASLCGCVENRMDMKREVIADRGVWTAKKRYALRVLDSEGVRYEEPKLKIMGLEVVKSSTPEKCRSALKDGIAKILEGDQNALLEHVAEFSRKFRSLRFEDVAFPRSVTDVSKWENTDNLKGCPIHARGAVAYNRALRDAGVSSKYETIKDGDKIRFAYMCLPNPLQTNVLSAHQGLPSEIEHLEKHLDYETQLQKAFVDPLRSIAEKASLAVEHRDVGLSAFF